MILCPQMSHLASNSVGGARSAAAAAAVTKNGQSTASSADPSTFRTGSVNQLPALNILNQANSISQLSANNTSFDPSQLVASSEAQQAEGVITAFSGLVVQNSSGDSGSSAAGVMLSSTSSMKGPNSLRVSPTLHQQQQQQHVSLQVQSQLVQSNQTIVQSSSPPTTVSPPPIAMMAQQQQVTHHHQSQMTYHHVQPLQPKPMQNGRVPATKHDNRKLFVGGLPNEGK